MLDGMDCGSGWQPDLAPFAQGWDGGIGLRLARRGHRPSGVTAQPLKMKLIYAATITLRDCNQIAVDVNLLPLLRQVTKQMCDVAADGAHVRALQFQLSELVQLVESERAVHSELVCADLAKLFL